MQYVVLTQGETQESSYQSFVQEVVRGARDGGADVELLTLDGILGCDKCNDEWGACKAEQICSNREDNFQDIQRTVRDADALCVIAPVQDGDLAEPVMNFLDRTRRCESGASGTLVGKPILVLAFPEGANNGQLACLEHMDRFCRQTGAVIFDFFSINSWNSDYTKQSSYSAGRVMAFGRKAGDPTKGTFRRRTRLK